MAKNCPFNYGGSKSDYPELHKLDVPVIDLFSGGGGFYSNVQSKNIIVNDVCKPLIEFQKLVYTSDNDEFESIIMRLYDITHSINSREDFELLRKNFNESGNPIEFMSCLSCSTNNWVRFNKKGGFNNTWGKRKFNPSMENKLKNFRNRILDKNIDFRIGSFEDINETGEWIYFVDPPYIISEAGYSTGWNEDMERKLYKYLDNKNFLLTNFIKRGEKENLILKEFVEKNNWKFKVIRTGIMRAQKKTDQIFEELLVSNSEELMNKISSI